MRSFLLLLATCSLTLIGGSAQAQSLELYKRSLATPAPSYQSTVEANEHATAAAAVKSMEVHPSGAKIQGYRVRIFLDNGQNARAEANNAIARFKEIFPGMPAYLSYENPYFKVTVGNCLTSEEAIILLGKIKDAFDRAFLVREEISLSLFGEKQQVPEENATTSEQ